MKLLTLKNILQTVALLAGLIVAFGQGCSKVAVTELPSQVATSTVGTTSTQDPVTGEYDDTALLKAQAQQVDLLFMLDDSASMKPDSLALAAKFEGFVRKLEAYSLDWQMCWTTTDLKLNGKAQNWATLNSPLLKKGQANLSQIFTDTINSHPFTGAGDERGVASMDMHLKNAANASCYRPGAALSVILISDENERSTGMNLQTVDQPQNYISDVQTVLSNGTSPVPHTVHSIITDTAACKAEQDAQGSPGYIGEVYRQLSNLTGGSVGSICSSDFSLSLNVFAEQIQKSLQRVRLNCPPQPGYQVSTMPAVANLQSRVEGNFLVIESQLTQDTLVAIHYKCQ